jgi:hypothetical protein
MWKRQQNVQKSSQLRHHFEFLELLMILKRYQNVVLIQTTFRPIWSQSYDF